MFHTGNPQLGWAVRTLDDIPEGTFVCAYFGNIHTEVDANDVRISMILFCCCYFYFFFFFFFFFFPSQIAKQHGDEYFADLDYMGKLSDIRFLPPPPIHILVPFLYMCLCDILKIWGKVGEWIMLYKDNLINSVVCLL